MRAALALILMCWLTVAHAQPVITSAAPDAVGVSIYRDPSGSGGIDLDNLNGFALITETRTVDLPPGPVTIRFEGVASGIQPRTALIIGADVREKNRDGNLLSQRGLLDAFTGQAVMLRRTDRATGKVTEEAATIRSGPDGIIVQTSKGFEPLYCTGLNETLLFPGVPRDLSAKPTLSMTTKDQAGGRRTITLAYLASGFDWRANYVAQLNADATAIDLFAWLTMASRDDTSFVGAQAAAIAGKVNREDSEAEPEVETGVNKWDNCWPADPSPPPVAEPAPMALAFESGEIVVTAQRRMEVLQSSPVAVMKADREDLGDLKLYRIPMPVTVAARAQKQVAFLVKPRVKGRVIYRLRSGYDTPDMLFRFKNDKASGLGDPLPAGGVALFQQVSGRQMLMGEARMDDKTTDEEVDLVLGDAANVTTEVETTAKGSLPNKRRWADRLAIVRNANPHPIQFEAEFPTNTGEDFSRISGRVEQRPGRAVWVVTVPANGTATLRYRATDKD